VRSTSPLYLISQKQQLTANFQKFIKLTFSLTFEFKMSKKKGFVCGNINKSLKFKFIFKIYGQKYITCIRFLLQESGFYYVLTRSFSSDAVEATFSHVRLRGGSNDAMDARTAEYAMRQILRCGIVKASKFSNTTENINLVSFARIQNLISRDRTKNLLIPLEIRIQIQAFRQITLPVENISSASVAFLAGYI
jgi:hypothetical protein